MKETSHKSTDCSISTAFTKIPELSKIHKEFINMPNFATPVQTISNPGTEEINRSRR